MFVLTLLFIALAVDLTTSVDQNCDLVQYAQVGKQYEIKNLNYPANYSKGQTCRWIAVCPTGYNCRLDCPTVLLPESPSCSGDRLLVSRTGDPQLMGATAVCSKYPFTVVSTAERLSVGLVTTSTSTGGSFRCDLYAQRATTEPTCTCGQRKQNRIVGGQETGVNEYPMMAAVITRQNGLKCGAVIISDKHVATAAHCMDGVVISDVFVLVGDHKLSTDTDTNKATGYPIRAYYIHPQYNRSTYDKDIAIIETTNVIQFNEAVGQVCLPFKYANVNLTGAKLTILGWGTLMPGGPTSDTLQKVDVDVISQDTCRRYVPGVTSSQICTLTPGKDACQMDSGGPLLGTDATTGLQFWIGTVSFGRFCASKEPGVNTRITELLDWIRSVTGVKFCSK